MKKNQRRLGRGWAFWRPLDPSTMLGSGNYVRVARFESTTVPLDVTEVTDFADGVFPANVEISEVACTLAFEGMHWVIPEPWESGQEPIGNFTVFDVWGINYEYQSGAYNLSSYLAMSYHLGSGFADNMLDGQLLIRAWGGPKRVCEWEFYRVRATKFNLPYNRNEFQKYSLSLPAMLNAAYTSAANPDGLLATFRSFNQQISKLG